jgi:hypothetical protein
MRKSERLLESGGLLLTQIRLGRLFEMGIVHFNISRLSCMKEYLGESGNNVVARYVSLFVLSQVRDPP